MTKIILGAILAYFGFKGGSPYSAIVFVEGIILINWGFLTWGKR